jgi:hypothetical protein
VIIVSLLLIGGAVGLLVLGLWQPSSALLSASIGASLLAVVVMVIGTRRPGDRDGEFALDRQPRHAADRTRQEREPAPATMRLLNLLPAGDDRHRHDVPGWSQQEREAPPGSVRRGVDASHDWAGGAPSGGEPAVGDQLLASRTEPRDIGTIPQQGRDPAGASPPDHGVPGDVDQAGPGDVANVTDDDHLADEPDAGYRDEESDDGYLADEPAIQQVSTADAVRVSRMSTEVLVVDGRPRYHLAGCVHLLGRDSEPLPVAEAVELGFSPCVLCEPDSALLANARHR